MNNKVYTMYHDVLCACYEDVASAYPAQYKVEQCRDLERLRERFRFEGVGFLTKTLPSLGKAIDKALATGTILNVPSFARSEGTKLPRFLGWLVGLVFSTDGTELAESQPVALVHIRQLLYLFYKLEMPYTDDLVQGVISDFVSVDSGLNTPWNISEPQHASVIHYAKDLIHRVLGGLSALDIKPKHGPGSVATGESLDEKAYFRRIYRSVTEVYPQDAFFYMNASHLSERLDDQGLNTFDVKSGRLLPLELKDTPTAKVVLVPKDSRGPRLISMEPLEVQWIQQGQMACLVKHIESNWLTRGHVNFTDQGINRYLAWAGSLSDPNEPARVYRGGSKKPVNLTGPIKVDIKVPSNCALPPAFHGLVTLDMKEASDRVSLALVQMLFPQHWVEALEATRSTHTELPSGEVIALNKFAPMGSAVCFPVEALVFWALALSAVYHRNPDLKLPSLRERVWVYGDDIVCYLEDYEVIKQSLERVGLLLNANKCCTAGFFRESCGLDAYKGVVVTPMRIKHCVHHRFDPSSLAAYVSYSNEAYKRGYTNMAEILERIVQRVAVVPYTTVDRGLVQFVRPDADVRALNKHNNVRLRWNTRWHILEAYGPSPKAVKASKKPVTYETYFVRFMGMLEFDVMPSPLDPREGLLTWLDRVRENTVRFAKQLPERRLMPDEYSIPRRVTAKRGWKQVTL